MTGAQIEQYFTESGSSKDAAAWAIYAWWDCMQAAAATEKLVGYS
jgi:hypothetical protein